MLRSPRKIRIGLYFTFCGVIFPIVLTDFFLSVTETLSAAFQSYVSHEKRSRRKERIQGGCWAFWTGLCLIKGFGGLPHKVESVGISQI